MRFPPADTHLWIAFDRAKKPHPRPDAPLALLAKHSYADADVEIVAAIVGPIRAPTKKRLITNLLDLSAEEATIIMSTDDESKAARRAHEIVSSLTPSTPRTDRIIILLGHAAGVATEGSMNVSSEATLNYVRAATALRAVCYGLENQRLTQEMIDRAKQAVDAWVRELT